MKNTSLFILCLFLSTTFLWAQEEDVFESRITAEHLNKAPAMLIPFPQQINWNNEFLEIKELEIDEIGEVSESIIAEVHSILDLFKIKTSKEKWTCRKMWTSV